MSRKILGIVGSYRRGGVIDTLVSEVLSAAEEQGAETGKIYLIDKHIEFCDNCRCCTQEQGPEPGRCVLDDDMADILDRYLASDGLVLGAPVNFFNVNAITRRFMERLVCFAYWPWGGRAPATRVKDRGKKAVLITSMAMPAFIGRYFNGSMRALKAASAFMGAKPIAKIWVGMVSQTKEPSLPESALRKARKAGRMLAQ